MLQIRRQHVIPRRKQAGDGDVQRLGRIGGQADVIRLRAAEQRRQRLARGEDRPGGGKALGVGAAAAVAHGLHGLHDRVDDAGRLAQGGRRVVQIDHTLASCHFLSPL